MSAKLNALVLLSIAALISGCGGGGSDGDGNDAAVSSSPTVTDPAGQAAPASSSVPGSGTSPVEQRAN